MQRIRNIIISALLLLGLSAAGLIVPTMVGAAAAPTPASSACTAIGSNANCDTPAGDASIGGIVRLVVNILSWVVGLIAVIMFIIGGLKYVTSGGDSNRVSSAKNTLIYAVVGLVIAALAQFMVQFVLNQTTTTSTQAGPKGSAYNTVNKKQ